MSEVTTPTVSNAAVDQASATLDAAIAEIRSAQRNWPKDVRGAFSALDAYEDLYHRAAAVSRALEAQAGRELEDRYREAVANGGAHAIAMADAGRHTRPVIKTPQQILREQGVTLASFMAPYRDQLRRLQPAFNAVG